MDSVIRGNPITREAHYFLDGNLTDPTLPRVTIRNSMGVAVVTDATPTRITTGIYQYVYNVTLSDLTGIWTAEWQGLLAGNPVGPGIDYFEVLPVGSIVSVPSSTYTYDLGTAVGQLRFLIQDHDMSSVSTSLPLEQRSAAFTDQELAMMLNLRPDLFMAAAATLRVWATNKQLIVEGRHIGKTDVDYGTIRRDMLAAADAYEQQAREQPADAIAEQGWTDFAYRQILWNEYQRGAV